jgi:hypothetical protein
MITLLISLLNALGCLHWKALHFDGFLWPLSFETEAVEGSSKSGRLLFPKLGCNADGHRSKFFLVVGTLQ